MRSSLATSGTVSIAEWRSEAESTRRFVTEDGRTSWIRPDGSGVLARGAESVSRGQFGNAPLVPDAAAGAASSASSASARTGLGASGLSEAVEAIKELRVAPPIAARLLQLVNEETASARAVAGLIGTDPALTSQVLRIANSPYRSASRSHSPGTACHAPFGLVLARKRTSWPQNGPN